MSGDTSDSLRFLPVGLHVRRQNCVVVGGGGVGARKALTLMRAGASVTVVSPTVTGRLAEQIEAGRLRWVKAPFQEGHLDGGFVAVAATDDPTVNESVVRAAERRGQLVCDASSAERSRVIFGALLESDDVTIAVFTDGVDPSRARRVRDQIAQWLARHKDQGPAAEPSDAS